MNNDSKDPWCLILCQKGREGCDLNGIEFGVTIGNSSSHIHVQQQGRSQRVDYEDQLSELLIFTSYENEGYQYSDNKNNESSIRKDIIDGITHYMGDDYIGLIKNICDISSVEENEEDLKIKRKRAEIEIKEAELIKQREELDRMEEEDIKKKILNVNDKEIDSKNEYHKNKEFHDANLSKQYKMSKEENKRLKIKAKDDYYDRKSENRYYKEDPKGYFKDIWENRWYDFLGIEINLSEDDFREQTKDIWIEIGGNHDKFAEKCKSKGLPYFDYIELYGKTPIEIHEGPRNKRRK